MDSISRRNLLRASAGALAALTPKGSAATSTALLVYGGTPAAITAAIQAARLGQRVTLVSPEPHLGGITVEGLGGSDINNHWFRNDVAVGGLANEFYVRIGKHYGQSRPVWRFEPHVAERIFGQMLAEHDITILRGQRLREPLHGAVEKEGTTLRAIITEDGQRLPADCFIDATLEGDLLVAAGVTTFNGRESNAKYGETKNGIRGTNEYRKFAVRVDPYWKPGVPSSGVIPTIQDEALGVPGEGDHRIQGFCYRMCLTRVASNRVPIEKPAGYDGRNYEIYRRYVAAGGQLFTPEPKLPGGKTDQGSWHDLSANLYGMNHGYPVGSYAQRERILEEHRVFTIGLVWFLQNEPSLPAQLREAWKRFGLPADEFQDNGHWPRQFYVRQARRLVSDLVLTESHTRRVNPTVCDDPVAVAYWPPDTHHVRRIIRDGAAYNEGFVFGGDDWGPFGISYRALVPRRQECTNLITACCPSSTHVAYGAIRLEWTFMALGQAAGAAASVALNRQSLVQDVEYHALSALLRGAGAVLSLNLPTAKPA
ncbi:MAG: FAD-dependent oxidoreductase [Bryobacterales bacterium]|nr:FAD-dependent oxidoreductase [Bryobacterales bacterium]